MCSSTSSSASVYICTAHSRIVALFGAKHDGDRQRRGAGRGCGGPTGRRTRRRARPTRSRSLRSFPHAAQTVPHRPRRGAAPPRPATGTLTTCTSCRTSPTTTLPRAGPVAKKGEEENLLSLPHAHRNAAAHPGPLAPPTSCAPAPPAPLTLTLPVLMLYTLWAKAVNEWTPPGGHSYAAATRQGLVRRLARCIATAPPAPPNGTPTHAGSLRSISAPDDPTQPPRATPAATAKPVEAGAFAPTILPRWRLEAKERLATTHTVGRGYCTSVSPVLPVEVPRGPLLGHFGGMRLRTRARAHTGRSARVDPGADPVWTPPGSARTRNLDMYVARASDARAATAGNPPRAAPRSSDVTPRRRRRCARRASRAPAAARPAALGPVARQPPEGVGRKLQARPGFARSTASLGTAARAGHQARRSRHGRGAGRWWRARRPGSNRVPQSLGAKAVGTSPRRGMAFHAGGALVACALCSFTLRTPAAARASGARSSGTRSRGAPAEALRVDASRAAAPWPAHARAAQQHRARWDVSCHNCQTNMGKGSNASLEWPNGRHPVFEARIVGNANGAVRACMRLLRGGPRLLAGGELDSLALHDHHAPPSERLSNGDR